LVAGWLAVVAACAGCGTASTAGSVNAGSGANKSSTGAPVSTPAPPPASTGVASATSGRPPHFDTPEAAMTYLAVAWNANDIVSLRHVTNPAARSQLDDMHKVAVNLRLDRCEPRQGLGDYTCYFTHDYPAGTPTTMAGGTGHAVFLVGPADTPGWYMTVFQSCG
jgi:hypothetical protein